MAAWREGGAVWDSCCAIDADADALDVIITLDGEIAVRMIMRRVLGTRPDKYDRFHVVAIAGVTTRARVAPAFSPE
ncbi:MAG: hypothetical protein WCH77_11625 [Planctomycetota bacterium]